ncbi:MAG: ferrochelatase [Nitrospirae bacterium]|nr:ferrochelatase [Nitrospirota bacterium]
MSADAVLMIAFGGPAKFEEVRPFLANVLKGRPVPPARVEQVVEQYRRIGGRSPILEWTVRQARALEERLRTPGGGMPVVIGMRHWPPTIAEGLERLAAGGARRVVGLIMAPHRSPASWEKYVEAVDEARGRMGERAPEVRCADLWHVHPLFLRSVAAVAQPVLSAEGARGGKVLVVFTAHSVPVEMSRASGYSDQVEASAHGVAEILGLDEWKVAYQSRSGRPEDPWLGPDIRDVIGDAARVGCAAVVVIPIGFVCDHVEVLFDLDIQARETAERLGVRFARVPTVGDHPDFIEMLADAVWSVRWGRLETETALDGGAEVKPSRSP